MKLEKKILHDEDLSKYTTIKIGGSANVMIFPHNIDELKSVLELNKDAKVLGGGSNLLINNRAFDVVINMREFDDSIIRLKQGRFIVGAGVRNQKLIKTINEDGFGGIEYLYSVPGLLGGAVVMNAGSGMETGQSISDYIISVTAVDRNGNVVNFKKDKCHFQHRNSIFKNNDSFVVVSAEMQFPEADKKVTEWKRLQRIEYCKKTQDNSAPNFGSVFKNFNLRIMTFFQKYEIGKKHGVHFSKKTANWILNNGGDDSYKEAKRLINIVRFIHKIFGKKCDVEVIMWE